MTDPADREQSALDAQLIRLARTCPHCGAKEPTLGSECPVCGQPYEPRGLIDRLPASDGLVPLPTEAMAGTLVLLVVVGVIYGLARRPVIAEIGGGVLVVLVIAALAVQEVQRRKQDSGGR